MARAHDAEVLLSNKIRVSAEHMAALPRLKFIAATATGVDHIDLEAARARGLAVANVRGYAVNTVPEHVFALMLALRRSLFGYREDVRAGRWSKIRYLLPVDAAAARSRRRHARHRRRRLARECGRTSGRSLRHAGVTGRAPRCHDDAPGHTPFDQVLAESDALTLHIPLTPETRHLIGAPEFARMKPGGDSDQHRARRAGGPTRTAGGAPERSPRRRRYRRARCRAAAPGPPAAYRRSAEPHRHAACRLGQHRSAAAPRRRGHGQRRGVRPRRVP